MLEFEDEETDNNSLYSLTREINNKIVSDALEGSITTNTWNKATAEEFENLIDKVKNGEISFKRAVGERLPFTEGISAAHAAATILIRRHERTDATKRRNPAEQYEIDAKEGQQQEQKIEAWAKVSDLWLNDYEDPNGNKANALEDLLRSQWEYNLCSSSNKICYS